MDAKRFVAGLMSTVLMVGSARAQEPPPGQPSAPPIAQQASPLVAPASGPVVLSVPQATSDGGYDVPGVSNWIRRETAPCCNGPIGKNSEIGTELYFRTGVSIPLADGPLLGRNTTTGFVVEGGARTLFYNHEFTKAWVIDIGISNTRNSGISNPQPIFLNALRPGVNGFQDFTVTVRDVNRTMVNLGFGREWFWTPAKDQPAHWRFGVDAGARWGSMRVNLREIVHRTDVIGGAYTGMHALYEFPCNNSIVNVGLRTDYSYTWSDIFQRASDLSEVNLMLNLGVRY